MPNNKEACIISVSVQEIIKKQIGKNANTGSIQPDYKQTFLVDLSNKFQPSVKVIVEAANKEAALAVALDRLPLEKLFGGLPLFRSAHIPDVYELKRTPTLEVYLANISSQEPADMKIEVCGAA